ncbi:unnamed protein product [Rotaria sp. Silwood2]|nr:unnamed protein product [Rotaria sp. Silwood2]CAF3931367.1 unnamed protein product [Rotaria sp. Silwood2]
MSDYNTDNEEADGEVAEIFDHQVDYLIDDPVAYVDNEGNMLQSDSPVFHDTQMEFHEIDYQTKTNENGNNLFRPSVGLIGLFFSHVTGQVMFNSEDEDFKRFIIAVHHDSSNDYVGYITKMANTMDPFGSLIIEKLLAEKLQYDRVGGFNKLITSGYSSPPNVWCSPRDASIFGKSLRDLHGAYYNCG